MADGSLPSQVPSEGKGPWQGASPFPTMNTDGPVNYPGVTGHGYQALGSRPRFSSSSRDIFPLPVPAREFSERQPLSRRSSQRFCRKAHIEERALEAIAGLNWMAGHGLEENSRIQPPDQLQRDVIGRALTFRAYAKTKGPWIRCPSRRQRLCRCSRVALSTA